MGAPVRTVRGISIAPFRIDFIEETPFEGFPWRVSEEVPLPLPVDDVERTTIHCDSLEEAERAVLEKLAERNGGAR